MPLVADKAPSTGGNRIPLIPEDGHICFLRWAIDLGLQEQRPYKGQIRPPRYEVLVGFEFQDFYMPDGDWDGDESTLEDHLDLTRPRLMSKRLRLYPNASRGNEFEIRKAIDPRNEYGGDWGAMAKAGAPCLVQVGHWERDDGVVREVIDGVSSLPSMFKKSLRDPVVPVIVFDLDDPDPVAYAAMPDWVHEVIDERLNAEETPFDFSSSDGEEDEAEPVEEQQELPW